MQQSSTAGAKEAHDSQPGFGILDAPPLDPADALNFYHAKLTFETDSADVYDALKSGAAGLVVVDARSREVYARGHVPGAVNLPWREMNETTVASLPRDGLIVTYCDGVGCNASTKGAAKLSALGFRVKEMPGGLDWWKRDGHPVEYSERLGSCHLTPGGDPKDCGC